MNGACSWFSGQRCHEDCVGSSLSGMFRMECLTRSLKLVDVSDVTIVTSSVAVAGACCALYESDVTAFHHFLVD